MVAGRRRRLRSRSAATCPAISVRTWVGSWPISRASPTSRRSTTKVDETLDRLVDKASDGKHDWSKEIKPWFGGQVAVSASGFPKVDRQRLDGAMADARFLLVATQKDPAAASPG